MQLFIDILSINNIKTFYNYIQDIQMAQIEQYGNYLLDRKAVLGQGQYGKVYKGYDATNWNEVAIKQSDTDEAAKKEVAAMQILNHPHIVKYYSYSENKSKVLIFMQYCNQGSLDNVLLRTTDSDQLIKYYSQIISGVEFMYNKKILHRDLKPGNILVNNNKIKIADFGVSKIRESNTYLSTLAGTPLFCSPQMIEIKQGKKLKYTQESDIFSLGLILYYMFNFQRQEKNGEQRIRKSLPWTHQNQDAFLEDVKTKPIKYKNENTPKEIQQIIKRMLTYEADKRMKFNELFKLEIFKKQRKQENILLEEDNSTLALIIPQKVDSTIIAQYKQIIEKNSSNSNQLGIQKAKINLFMICLKQISKIKTQNQLTNLLAKKSYKLHEHYLDKFSFSNSTAQFIASGELKNKYPGCHMYDEKIDEHIDQILKVNILNTLKRQKEFINTLKDRIDNFVEEGKLVTGQQIKILYGLYYLLIIYTIEESWDNNFSKPNDTNEFDKMMREQIRRRTIASRLIDAYKQLQI